MNLLIFHFQKYTKYTNRHLYYRAIIYSLRSTRCNIEEYIAVDTVLFLTEIHKTFENYIVDRFRGHKA